jgi:hypothetical protein
MDLVIWLVFAPFLFAVALAELLGRLLDGESPLRAVRRWAEQIMDIVS